MNQSETGLYIHIPFCSKRCSYCDFFSLESSDRDLIDHYSRKVVGTVLERVGEFSNFSTVYFGGGSPSMLSEDIFREFRETVLCHEKFKNVKEFTVEINPADIDENWLRTLSENGVNRISAGIQAMDDNVLGEMGRRTRVADIKKNLPLISKHFKNVSVDIIYGLGKKRNIKKEINDILELAEIDHFSAYEYTRPERINAPELLNEEEVFRQEREIRAGLDEKGYERYEISNYSKNGKRSLHNMIYWSYGSWLGIGSGAHSFNSEKGEHSFYQPDINEFINGGGLSRFTPSENELMEEFLLMGLRTTDGIKLNKFKRLFDVSFEDIYSSGVVKELEKEGLLSVDSNNIVCTEKGFDLLNNILIRLFESGENDR